MTNLTYGEYGVTGRGQAQTLFAQTMGLVAVTAGIFTLGAYLGRNLSYGVGIVAYIAAFICLLAMRFAVRRSPAACTVLLLVFGALIGVATAPVLAYYAATDPSVLW
jgi:FtsH-binding integral membrane protein